MSSLLITYVIDNTEGTLSFQIKPGELDGPRGTTRHSDFRLYGNGALRWGEGMDENILRLAESSAAPRKESNDYNQKTGKYDFDATTEPPRPKDEYDLGASRGITKPLNGQLWYSTTDKTLYIYDGPADTWIVSGQGHSGTQPPVGQPTPGDEWFHTGYNFNKCPNFDATPIVRGQVLIYDPTHPESNDGWVSLSENYVSQYGDWMGGVLDMDGKYYEHCFDCTETTFDPEGKAFDGSVAGNRIVNLGDPKCLHDAVNKQYVDSQGAGSSLLIEQLASVVQDHFQNRAGRNPQQSTTININGKSYTFDDNRHLEPNEEVMLRNANASFGSAPSSPSGSSAADVGKGITRINYKLDKEEGGEMEGWLTLKNEYATQDYHPVPLKQLQELVGGAFGGLDKKRIYYYEKTMYFSGIGSGPQTVTCDFSSWINDYRAATGGYESFTVLPVVTHQGITMQNAGPSAEGVKSFGRYSIINLLSEVVSKGGIGTNYTVTLNLGSRGRKSDQSDRSYSTGAPTAYRLLFFGGSSDLFKWVSAAC